VSVCREDEAYTHFQSALVSEPDDPIALLQSGVYLVKQGRYQESIENLERFVQTSCDPREITSAYRYLGGLWRTAEF